MKPKNQSGFTMVELMMVVIILGLLASLVVPHFDLILVRAYQAKAKSNLGYLRTAMGIYYADNDGTWPLQDYPAGDSHYTNSSKSLSTTLYPVYMQNMPAPFLKDRNPSFNGMALSYDSQASTLMSLSPPKDVFIISGAAAYTALLNSPYAYDNQTGELYVSNGNYDIAGNYFYEW